MHVLVEIDWRADQAPEVLLSMRPLVLPRHLHSEQAIVTEEKVVKNRGAVGQQDLLEHHGDPDLPCRNRAGWATAVDLDDARVGSQDTSQQLCERALAAAILSDDSVDLTRTRSK